MEKSIAGCSNTNSTPAPEEKLRISNMDGFTGKNKDLHFL
jgi:hypothetical protein